MPRCKLEKLVDNPSPPRKYTRKPEPAIDHQVALVEEQPIVPDFSAAIETFNLPVITPSTKELKKLAGTPFLVDTETGLIYLEPTILKALKNN